MTGSTQVTSGRRRNVSMVRVTTGFPASSRYSLGPPPMRAPVPAATMTTAMGFWAFKGEVAPQAMRWSSDVIPPRQATRASALTCCAMRQYGYSSRSFIICVKVGHLVHDPAFSLSIGEQAIRNRAFLAPMAGITDRPMRRLAARYGAGLVVSEMIASNALSAGNQDMRRKLAASPGLPHMVQLAGCEAEWMARAAAIAEDSGADIIDINFGCPAKRVTNGYAGSALMRVPDLAQSLVEAVVGETSRPVNVKMWLGCDDDRLNAPEIARRAVDAGAQMITVHGC